MRRPLVTRIDSTHFFIADMAIVDLGQAVREPQAGLVASWLATEEASMPVLTLFLEHMQRFIHPIRAIVFGANVLPITRGVTEARQTVEFEPGYRAGFNRYM